MRKIGEKQPCRHQLSEGEEGRGASGATAAIPLQPVEETTVRTE